MSVARPVSVGRLIDAVWGDAPPNSVTNVIQVYVSSLRKLLRSTELAISRTGSTYTLDASLDDIDVEVFHRHSAEGRSALRALEPERALVLLERAWDLWDPTPFTGLEECPFVATARASLLSSGLSVATDRGAALCVLGRSDEAAAAAQQLVEANPFYEPAWDLLMRALYHSGRQHDALMVFGRARATFVEELGLDPPASLAELERQILDRSLEPITPRAQSPAPGDEPAGRIAPHLPAPPSGMIGRTAEVERVVQLVDEDARLITLVGLGGIGKTTTALAAGQRLSSAGHTVAFADLAAAVESTIAIERMCEAASVSVGSDAAASLAAADPDLVLITDNGEQIADFPQAIATLLSTTSRVQLIVTSRVALRIRAEHVLPIHPLETASASGASDAALLFVERARRLRDDLDLAGDENEIVEICELAGGIPLAIEVAAGRLGRLTPLALLERLRRQSVALLDGRSAIDMPDRQQSLRTVLDATSTLLTDGGATLARRLCVLKGPISLAMMAETLADEPDLIDHFDELADAGLVDGPDDAERYRMPIPVSDYFAGRHQDCDGDRRRILRAVLSIAESLVSKVDQRGRWAESGLLDDAAAVTVACDAAIAQRDTHAASRLVVALRRYWLLGSRLSEALQFCQAVLELSPGDTERAHVQLVLGQFAAILNRPDAGTLLSGGIQIAEANSGVEPHLVVNSWCYLGSWLCDHGDLEGARHAATRVDELTRASTDQSLLELSRDFGAYVAARVGDFETAARLGAESLVAARLGGDRYVVIDLLYRVAENLLELGRLDEADSLIDEAMEIARTTPIGPLAAKVLQVRAAVDIEQGGLSTAIGTALEALRLTSTLYPDPVTQASVLRILAAAWCSAGDLEAAARCDGAAVGILQRVGAPVEAISLNLIDRRLDASRQDPRAQTIGRIAAMDPGAVVDQLLDDFGQ